MKQYSAETAREQLNTDAEIALLDVREAGQFGEAHALFAVPAPYSRLELIIGALVPRANVPIILIDNGDGISELSAQRLQHMGYAHVNLIAGGMPAWSRAGYPVYKGVNVPSKTLGELAEAIWHPNTLNADQLVSWGIEGREYDLFDARPATEYSKMRIPGARCLPNGELAYRLAAIIRDPDRPLVITCAGRTRGIAGVIGMTIAGYEGAIYALENGTQGWALANQALERGNPVDSFPQPDQTALDDAHLRASRIASNYQIETVTAEDIQHFFADGSQTTYVFDVRSIAEAAADPIAVAVAAPCGQIVQATDQWVGVRNSRVVLCCDTGLRAAIAAFWLKQLGYETKIAHIDDSLRRLQRPPAWVRKQSTFSNSVGAAQTLRELDRGNTLLIDLRDSMSYRTAHINQAIWCTRARIPKLLADHAKSDIALISDDMNAASLVSNDCHEAGITGIAVVEGGHTALVREGAKIVTTPNSPTDTQAIDYLFFVHDRHDGNRDASLDYLAWETQLTHQLDECERNEFLLLTPV